jgi:hypothetical protein
MGTDAPKDYFYQWWDWATNSPESMLIMPAVIHSAVMELSPEDRRDREKVNDAARRNGWREL